ncbi:MAG TPA: DUF1232 domain-containing protein [bacterium]|nr:DUF1232 domain-containing protein [bacterium]
MKPELKLWTNKAKAVLQDKERLESFLKEAVVKADRNKSKIRRVWSHLKALARMIRAWAKGEYRRVPASTLVAAAAALVYFLNPFDLVPDFLPVGLIDDALFIGWVLSAIQTDVEKFLDWERTIPVTAENVE